MDENLTRGYVQLGRDSPSVAEKLTRSSHLQPPEDRCRCIYFALVLAGAGFLLPYNSFIIAVDYFQERYPGTTVVFDMSLVYILIAFVAVILNNILIEAFTLHTRITFGYLLSFFTLLFVALCEIWFEMFSLDASYNINLIAVAVVAFGCTVQQSSFYGYTSMLPSRYTQAVMTGESAAGLLVSANRILTKALLDDEKVNTIIFFCLSISLIWMCFIVHHVIRRTEFVRFYISMCASAGIADDQRGITHEPTEEVSLVDILDVAESKGSYGVLTLQSPSSPPPDSAFQSTETLNQEMGHNKSHTQETIQANEITIKMRGTSYVKHLQIWSVIKRGVIARWRVSRNVWPYMLSISLAYFVTLCLFPGIEAEIISCRLGNWMPVILMAIFNLFDFIGKIIASVPYEWSRLKLILCSLSRIIMVPMMMMTAAPRIRPLIVGEGWAMFFSLLLGITNGYFGSVPMIIAPSKVSDEHKELTGNIMTLSYSVGLTAGSLVAYYLDSILGPLSVNPCLPSTILPTNLSFVENIFNTTILT